MTVDTGEEDGEMGGEVGRRSEEGLETSGSG